MIAQVHPAQLQAWFEQLAAESDTAPDLAPRPLVLDVREPWELQTASIRTQGFETLAIPMGSIPDQLATLDKARPIACLCHHGVRSQRVAAFLAHQGFEYVANITGGINAWSHEFDSSVPLY